MCLVIIIKVKTDTDTHAGVIIAGVDNYLPDCPTTLPQLCQFSEYPVFLYLLIYLLLVGLFWGYGYSVFDFIISIFSQYLRM